MRNKEELHWFLQTDSRIQNGTREGNEGTAVTAINATIFFETNGYTTGKYCLKTGTEAAVSI
jgi:hypothetical protein